MTKGATLRSPSWDGVKEEQVVKGIMVNYQGHWYRVRRAGSSNDRLSIHVGLSSKTPS